MVEDRTFDKISKLKPLFGVADTPVLDAHTLEAHVEALAADLEARGDPTKLSQMETRDLGLGWVQHGLWDPGAPESRFTTSLFNHDALAREIDRMAQDGFAPIDIVGSDRLFEPWTVAFRKSPPDEADWIATPDHRAFSAKADTLRDKGFRLKSFNRRHGFFNATWEKGTTAELIMWDMTFIGLLASAEAYKRRGFRVVAIDRYGEYGNRYAAVWHPGEGDQIIEAPGGINVYFGQPSRLLIYKYENRGMHVAALGHSGYPIAAYRPKPYRDGQGWFSGSLSYFKQHHAWRKSEGYGMTMVTHAEW